MPCSGSAQLVRQRLPLAKTRVHSNSKLRAILVDKMTLGQVCLPVHRFGPVSITLLIYLFVTGAT